MPDSHHFFQWRTFCWAVLILTVLPSVLHAREWTDSTGTFRVEAELVAVRKTSVILEKPNGQIVAIPISRLSGADQAFILEQQTKPVTAPTNVAPPASSSQTDAQNRSLIPKDGLALAAKAEVILRAACYRCHGEDGTSEGGFNFVANLEKLATTFAKPGAPSLLLERITNGEDSVMPPAGEEPRLSEGDINVIRSWIQAGAPTQPTQEMRPFIRNEEVTKYIKTHINGIGERNRRFMRYFTLTHLYNAGVSEDELQTYRNAFSKLLNSLSWNTDLVIPQAIDPAKTVFAIDIRSVHWTSEIWQAIEDANPYFLELPTPEARACSDLAETRMPYVRVDWFVFAASKPPLYHTVLGLPETDQELESLLRVNVAANISQEQAIRAGFNRSGVSQNNRLIEWHKSPYGSYWKSYDFGGNIGRQNLFENPLGPDRNGFQHDGGEIIFTLPNGLQGYLLADENGRRIDQGPTNIVSDPKQPDRTVTNGVSCMSCHYAGIIPKGDEVGVAVRANRKAFEEADDILALYRESSELSNKMATDAAKFAEVLEELGINNVSRSGEAISAIAARFQIDIDLRNAAAEFGLKPEEFLARLTESTQVARMFSSLTIKAGTIKRDVFKDVFTDACIDLGLVDRSSSSVAMPDVTRGSKSNSSGVPPRIASGRMDSRGRLVTKVTQVAIFDDLTWGVSSLAISPDGQFLAAGRPDRSLVLFDVAQQSIASELRDLESLQQVAKCGFTPDGKYLLVGGHTGQIRVYEIAATGMLKEAGQFAGHAGEITSMAVSSDGRYVLSGSQEKKARYWEIASGQEAGLIDGFNGAVKAVHVSRNNATLQATDGEVLIEYDARRNSVTRSRPLTRSWASGQAAAFSPAGDFVAVGDTYNVRVWNVKTGREMPPLVGTEIQWTVQFSPDGQTLYTGGNAKVGIWNVSKAQRTYMQETSGTGYIQALAVSDDGKLFSAPGSSNRKLHVFQVP